MENSTKKTYTREELEILANKETDDLTTEENKAVWEYLRMVDKEWKAMEKKLKEEYPQLTYDEVIDIMYNTITLEEALNNHK